MKRIITTLAMTIGGCGGMACTAHAGVFGTISSWITGEATALLISAAIVAVTGLFGTMFVRVSQTFREAGEFLSVLGDALEDKRITRDELVSVIREGRDMFDVWK